MHSCKRAGFQFEGIAEIYLCKAILINLMTIEIDYILTRHFDILSLNLKTNLSAAIEAPVSG